MTEVKAEEVEETEEEPKKAVVTIKLDGEQLEEIKEDVLEKSGRRNSKADADKLEQAIALIQDVLGQLDDTEESDPENGEDEVKANAAPEEPERSNPRKDALLDVITKIKDEEI